MGWDWKSLVIRPASEEEAKPPPHDETPGQTTPTRSPSRNAGTQPVVIADLLDLPKSPVGGESITPPATPSSANAPSARALQLAQRAMEAIPSTNPTMQLATMMRSLKDIISNDEMRKKAAFAALLGQGITEEMVASGMKEARGAVGDTLNNALAQIDSTRSNQLTALRGEATALRNEVDGVERQIADLSRRKEELEAQATNKDAEADELDTNLNTLKHDIETARTIATSSLNG